MRVLGVLTRIVLRAGLFGSACIALGCGSGSTTVVGPSGEKCEISVTNNTPELPATGGNGSLAVATSRDCTWSASADASWVTLMATSGQGAATVNYSVLPNPDGTPRRSRVAVEQQQVEVAQAAAPCRYEASPSTLNLDAAEHQVGITLTAPNGCAWAARSDVPWLSRAEPADGAGSATVRVTVAANPTDARTGTVVIANATVRVNQSGAAAAQPPMPQPPTPAPTPGPAPVPACTYGIAPERTSVAAAGDEVTVAVTVSGGCMWTAISNASWIRIAAGGAGSGSGSVQVSISANTGGPRSGTVRVASETFTVQQAGACTFGIKPNNYHAGRGPDSIAIDVTATSACTWTTATDAAWVTVAAGRSGSGNGVVRLEIPANNGPARTAVVTIADKTFTLSQNGLCNPTIKPEYYNAGRGPDTIVIRVSAGSGCPWTAASPVSWVSVAEGAAGSGDGIVRLLVQPNSGARRAVTLTIAGQPFALTQAGPQ